MGRTKASKRRKSYITIVLVVAIIAVIALILIAIYNNKAKNKQRVAQNSDYTSLLEEDEMQYEYSKIDSKLNGLCAFAISGENVVGVDRDGNIIPIYTVNSDYSYDYIYFEQSLYLLEKETGIITIISLKKDQEEYEVKDTVELGKKVDQIQIYDKELYYLSNNTLYSYINESSNVILENIESNSFVIKKEYIYVIKNGNLVKVSVEDMQEEIVASSVTKFNYFNYYEKNKIIFETNLDGKNYFKNIYNFYTGEITNSINNKGYFVPYGSNEYIYTNNDSTTLILIDSNGNNKNLYKSDTSITNVSFFRSGYVLVEEENKIVLINIDTKNVEDTDILKLDNIKYIK